MFAFTSTRKPRSVQAKHSEAFKSGLADDCRLRFPNPEKLSESLYGIVYYFHKVPTELDADNLSKPIWDSLEGLLYRDDKIIKLRYSGIYDLRNSALEVLDITKIPEFVFDEFIDRVSSEPHILIYRARKVRLQDVPVRLRSEGCVTWS
jgi:Holliday junction resolvase RusA-like endonuclease